MIKKILLYLLSSCIFFSCSFDKVSGIWSGTEKEKRRLGEIQIEQKETLNKRKLYSTENIYNTEIQPTLNTKISKPEQNTSWDLAGYNNQNLLKNFYLPAINNRFLKKKFGKNKFPILKTASSPIISNETIFLSDDRGTIYNLSKSGSTIWKKNIYKKMYKNIYKYLSIIKYKNSIYVSDNIGFLYSLSADTGELLWAKNHGIPLKSKIKIFEDKIILINQDNRILTFNSKDGTKLWDVRSVSSFIKSQQLLSVAISKNKKLFALTSAGDLLKIDVNNGRVEWLLNTLASLKAYDTDFFSSSDIVIDGDKLLLSAGPSFFSFDLATGFINWKKNYSSSLTPIVILDNIFIVTNSGYLLNINKANGNIIWSINILSYLKRKKQNTLITGFILGSGKIYATTANGYIVVLSASTGTFESTFKVADSILVPPIIVDGALYVLSNEPKIIGLN